VAICQIYVGFKKKSLAPLAGHLGAGSWELGGTSVRLPNGQLTEVSMQRNVQKSQSSYGLLAVLVSFDFFLSKVKRSQRTSAALLPPQANVVLYLYVDVVL
jgi:hypothetical protein